MKRRARHAFRGLACAAVATLVAIVAGQIGQTSAGAASVTVGVRDSALGEILVAAGGRALYHTSAEGKGVIKCTGTCAVEWPPLLVSARVKPVAGSGVKASLLGTVKRPNGRIQVTYRGLPLYRFSRDTKAGELGGQGNGGLWHLLRPSGKPVTAALPASSKTSSGTSSSSSSNTSSGIGSGTSTTSSGTGSSGGGAGAGMWCAANPKSCVNGVPVTGTTQ